MTPEEEKLRAMQNVKDILAIYKDNPNGVAILLHDYYKLNSVGEAITDIMVRGMVDGLTRADILLMQIIGYSMMATTGSQNGQEREVGEPSAKLKGETDVQLS